MDGGSNDADDEDDRVLCVQRCERFDVSSAVFRGSFRCERVHGRVRVSFWEDGGGGAADGGGCDGRACAGFKEAAGVVDGVRVGVALGGVESEQKERDVDI